MSKFPELQYSKGDVVRAGKALEGKLIWSPETEQEVLRTFQVTNNWLASHALPMAQMRAELQGRMRAVDAKGLSAARLKQMQSIRSKLTRISSNLRQLQDLGGCRAVVPSIDDARRLVSSIKETSRHELKREDPYMDAPRVSGYRSHHLIYSFEPRNDHEEGFRGRLIEIQIRSRLQHSWSTAVEAVGMFLQQKIKASEGNPSWLRLFELMSFEIAEAENVRNPNGDRDARVSEIIELARSLEAEQVLDTISHAVSGLEQLEHEKNHTPRFCQILYDHQKRRVRVRYIDDPAKIGDALTQSDKKERSGKKYSSVVVELDRVENLRDAYPNYFGDVQLFKNNLTRIVGGDSAREYYLPPVVRIPPKPRELPDDSWFRHPSRRWKD